VRKAQWWDAHLGYFPESVELEVNEDPADDVVRIVRQLWEDQGADRQQRQVDCTELYYGCDWSGDDEGSTRDAMASAGIQNGGVSGYNVIQSITDTSVSRLVQNRVRPLILTEGGDATQQQQAQSLQKVIEGTFWDAKIYGELGQHVCFDGHLYDAGGVKVYPDFAGKRLVLDRIDPSRFMVSRRESRLGTPRSGYYYDAIDRSELLAQFRDADAETIQAIIDAPVAPEGVAHREKDEDFVDDVEIMEAWHLPSSSVDRTSPTAWGIGEDGEYDPRLNPGHDGRRVLCIQGKTLIDEPWPFPYFPIAWFKPLPKRRSYWSRSVPEVLAGAQLLLNNINSNIDEIMHFHSHPMLIVWRNAKLNATKITNSNKSILESNVPPQQALYHVVPQAVPGEYLTRQDKIIAWAEKQWGMNDMAMSGQKPASIEHAPALEHLSDELSARHTVRNRAWELFHTDLGQLVIDGHRMLADHCKRNGEDYSVVFGGDRDLEEIDWEKADLGAAVYRVKCWPTNLLPNTPAARANKLIEWMQAGLITAEQAMENTDHPDTEAILGNFIYKRKNIEKKIEKLLGGEPMEKVMPNPYMDLKLCLTIASNKLNELESKGFDEASLDKLRNWYEVAKKQDDAEMAKQAALQAPPAPGPMPGGPGAPPPVGMPAPVAA
jgi:hypothetical protein